MNTGMEYEDVLMRNQQLAAAVKQLQDEMVRANQHTDEQFKRIQELLGIIGSARILLFDYDGYYDPDTKTGDAEKLSGLIDEVEAVLNKVALTDDVRAAMDRINKKYENTLRKLAE